MPLPEGVRRCAAALKEARSDTDKFAALFLAAKLLKAGALDEASRTAIFEAIGSDFLKKLLATRDLPEDCPASLYKSVALSILAAFCADPVIAAHPETHANLEILLDIVRTSDDDDSDDNLMLVNEAYTCLRSIVKCEPGRKALLQAGAISKLTEIYAQQSFQTDEALQLLVSLVSHDGPRTWGVDPKPFHSLVNKIALDFETDHSERKFELATILNGLICSCNKSVVSPTASDEIWPLSMYKGLTDILTSRIGKTQRDPALKLASAVVDLLGIEWTLNDEENPKKFFLLLVQLCSIEVRMQLEDKSFKQALANADLVTACFIILELAINYMGNDQIDLEQKEKQTVYTGLKGAFSAIVSILTKVSNDKNRDKLPDVEKLYVCAMVRVLVAWLAQETTAMRDKVYVLLPYMLGLANDTFYAYRSRKLSEKRQTENMELDVSILSQVDILRVMLPSLCHLAVEDKARSIILASKQDEVLYECMAFHWDIVHYKKPPIPKSERGKVKTNPEPEIDPFLLEQMKDSRTAMISLCNIFMNLTVLETKHVEESALFNTLMKFLFNNLPELKNSHENLVLYGHLAILGLLLLKQQSKKVKKNDFSICRYIQSTIRFLWDAYNVDESNDPTALVVSMTYKERWSEIMELWFLGMQTMSSVLALVPWISEFAMESGWAEGILEMLIKVKVGSLPPNVKSAFEDFLCHLVDANPEVDKVLKKADALKVCRNHRFMELGKKLFGD